MTLLAAVSAVLDAPGVAHAVIGAAALAVHGVTRSTAAIDLLTVDTRCLDDTMWTSFAGVDVRRGDAADPLAGVIRVVAAGEPTVDVIVGRPRWQRDVVARAVPGTIAGTTLGIVTATDLVLLKLHAGGARDAQDVDQLLDGTPGLEREVARARPALPRECRTLWERIVSARAA